ncbi:spore germination protein [Alicyclobacillus sp. SO9]|nr:spore germination protein [Alicyclobacillus sp. SO9]
MQTNLALVRKRLRTSKLKIETLPVGTKTNVQLALLYVEGIVKPGLVEEAHQRLHGFKSMVSSPPMKFGK